MTRHIAYRHGWATRSGGFTLVELLVTVTIIGMLAAMVLGAVQVSREAARKMKTRSTIRKIEGVVMDLYESYHSRRVPLNTTGLSPQGAAVVRLQALRDLIRMEMPERWSDLNRGWLMDPIAGVVILDPRSPPAGFRITRSSLSQAYDRQYQRARDFVDLTYGPSTTPDPLFDEGRERLARYGSAECLYLIVSMAGGADARGQFHENEIGDADGDGLFEFHDGWGNPILFLRWAPGLVGSPLQIQILDPYAAYTFADAVTAAEAAALNDHDPFDTRNLHSYAFRMIPYIYSAGPDGIYDINVEGGYRFTSLSDPYTFLDGGTQAFKEAGLPVNSRNYSVTAMDPPAPAAMTTSPYVDHFDNIDNHSLEAR